MSKKLGLGVLALALAACGTTVVTAPPAEVVTVEVPQPQTPVVITVEVPGDTPAPLVVTATPEPTITPLPFPTATISEWWDGQRIENQIVRAHARVNADVAFTVRNGETVFLVGQWPTGENLWLCIQYEEHFGWVDSDQLTDLPENMASVPSMTPSEQDDPCFSQN